MVNKKILSVLALFLILFIAISATSAANDGIFVEDASDSTDMGVTIQNGSPDDGTFTDLQSNVTAAINDEKVLELHSSYIYNETTDLGLSSGVEISGNLTINGNGFTIDGSSLARIFNIAEGTTVTINNVTFTHGNANANNGGAINNLGDLTLNDCAFIENYINYQTDKEIYGGAIYSAPGSTLRVSNSVFRRNCEGAEFFNGANTEARRINGGAIATINAKVIIDNCLFDENTARWGSAAQFWESDVELTNSNFTNNNVYAGTIYLNGLASITNCKFTNNDAKYVGSVGFIASGADLCVMGADTNLTVDECTFDHSQVTSSAAGAGSIHIQGYVGKVLYNMDVSILNSNFTNIMSPERAAVYVSNASLYLNKVAFENCSAKIGGAIYNLDGTIKAVDTEFTKCSAVNGGAIYNNGILVLDGCTFTENYITDFTAERFGGAIYSGAGSTLTIDNSVFTKNCKGAEFSNGANTEARIINGGAIYTNQSNVIIDNCLFDANTARWGSACQFIDSEVELTNSNITNSNVYAGAIYVIGNLNVTNCKFTNNNAKYVGSTGYVASGADICIMNYANVNIDGCTFENSTVTSPVAGAGSIHIQAYSGKTINISIADSKFTNVKSSDRAAIFAKGTGSTLTIDECTFDKCTATTGGAIYLLEGSASVSNSKFTNCSAVNGGAIYSMADLTIDGCNFTNNYITDFTVQRFGGAIYSGAGSTLTVTDSVFTENCKGAFTYKNGTFEAKVINGGAIYTEKADVTIENTLFDRNTARWGSAAQFWESNVELTNCNITNSNVYAGAIYLNGNVNITNCKFDNNQAKFVGSTGYVASGSDLCIMGADSNVLIDDCSFTNSKVVSPVAGAGSIHIEADSKINIEVTIKNSEFKNINSPTRGAVYVIGATLNIDGCTFENCSATTGGAIYANVGSTLTVNNSVFRKNCYGAYNKDTLVANEIDGGAIYTKEATVVIDKTLFDENTGRWGSAAQFNGGNVKVMNSEIINNNVYSGAFYINANTEITNCKFKNNDAKYIGSVGYKASGADLTIISWSEYAPQVTIDGCTFDNSKATSTAAGAGSVHIETIGTNTVSVAIKNSKFNNVESENRAAIYVLNPNSSLTVENTEFTQCDGVNGGAIFNNMSTVTVTNSKFTNCVADNGGAILNYGTLTVTGSKFSDNSDPFIYNKGTLTLSGNTADGYIYNKGTINGIISVLSDKYVAITNNTEGKTIKTLTLRAKLVTAEGNILVYSPDLDTATVTCDHQKNSVLTLITYEPSDYFGYYVTEDALFTSVSGVKVYNTTLSIKEQNTNAYIEYADNGAVILCDNPEGSLSQLKELIEGGFSVLSNDFAYNSSCDEGFTPIVLTNDIEISSNLPSNIVIDTTGANIPYIFDISSAINVNLTRINFVSNTGSDINLNNSGATLTVTDCSSTNTKSINYVAGNLNTEATVLDGASIYTTAKKIDVTATVNADGLDVYSPDFRFIHDGMEIQTQPNFDNGIYKISLSDITEGKNTISFTAGDVTAGYVIRLTNNDLVLNAPEFVYRGGNLTIDVVLNYIANGTVKLYVTNLNEISIGTNEFTLGADNKYHYYYNLTTVSYPEGSISAWAKLYDNKDTHLIDSNMLFVNVVNHVPEIEVVYVSGNYSQKVNITVRGNYTAQGDVVVLHHIDGYNLTATIGADGTATFYDVLLSKANNNSVDGNPFETEVIYLRDNVAKTTAPVTWDISQISTNVTFNVDNVTGKVNQTLYVTVTVTDFYGNLVKSGQITVTSSNIVLSNPDGVYNLTNGEATISFRYTEAGEYNLGFEYTNPSIWSNNDNYLLSTGNLDANITKNNVTVIVNETSRNITGTVYTPVYVYGNVTDESGNIPVGTVTITLNDVEYNATVNNSGLFSIKVNATSSFTANDVSVKFVSGNTSMWDDTDSVTPNLVNITINPINTTVNVDPVVYNKTAGEAFNITGNVTSADAKYVPTGKVTIVINGTTYEANLTDDGKFYIPVTIDNAGSWTNLNVSFTSNQTGVFNNSTSKSNINVTINRLNTTITITDVPADYVVNVNETFTINGTVTAENGENASGIVKIFVNGQEFNATVTDGVFHIENINSTIGLNKAAYNITFISNNDTRWNNCTGLDIVNITVNKLNTTMAITTDDIIVTVINETYYINGTVTDDVYHNGVYGNVTVTINGTTYNVTTGADGKFSFALNSSKPFGPENCTVKFVDFNSSVYNAPKNQYVNVTVNKLNTTLYVISVIPESAYVGQNITITGNLTDDYYHKGVSGVIVFITVNGIKFNDTTDENGSFVINVTSNVALANATYNVSVSEIGDIYNIPKNVTVSFEFKKLPTSVIVDPIEYEGYVNSTIYINGTVNDTINNKAANGTVFIELNGIEFNATVGADGKFSIPVSCNVSGIYDGLKVRFVTNNDKYWENSNSTDNIKVTINALDVFIVSNYDGTNKFEAKYDRTRNYTFNVTDSLGNKVQNGTAYLYIKGHTYTAEVSNGQVTFENITLDETGLFNYIVDYEGNEFYNFAFNFTNINVSPIDTYIVINSSISDNNKILNISVYEKDTNNLVKEGVIYYVTPDGQEHMKELVNGSAIIGVVANRTGEYNIAVSYYHIKGGYKYSSNDFKYNITVINLTTIYSAGVKVSDGVNDNVLTITSNVVNERGEVINTGKVLISVNGVEEYVDVVNGIACKNVEINGPVMVITKYVAPDSTEAISVDVVELDYNYLNSPCNPEKDLVAALLE